MITHSVTLQRTAVNSYHLEGKIIASLVRINLRIWKGFVSDQLLVFQYHWNYSDKIKDNTRLKTSLIVKKKIVWIRLEFAGPNFILSLKTKELSLSIPLESYKLAPDCALKQIVLKLQRKKIHLLFALLKESSAFHIMGTKTSWITNCSNGPSYLIRYYSA